MLEIHRGISWRAVRSWIGEHVGVLLVVGVTVYLVGFFLYQALAPVQALLWQETASYTVGDSCRLLLEYPSRILLEPSTESGHPITARLWVISTAPSGPVSPSAGCSANQEPVS